MKSLAKFISIIGHPIWMPLYVIFIFWSIDASIDSHTNNGLWVSVTAVVFINSILIPVLLFWMMKKLQIIESLSLSSSKDRFYPFLITGIFYLTTWFVFFQLGVMDFVSYTFALSTILVSVVLIINLFWKISIHTVAIGALSAFIIYMTAMGFISKNWPSYIVIISSGLIGFSRLQLKAHSAQQVYAGFLLGVLVSSAFLLSIV